MKRYVTLVACLCMFAPFVASADTIADLQAQVAALLAQLEQLQSHQMSSTSSPCLTLTRNLGKSSRGADVLALQQFLILQNLLSSNSATGYFGTLTEAAVQRWQTSQGIVSSGTSATTGYGSIGPRSRSVLAQCSVTTQTTTITPSTIPTTTPALTYPPVDGSSIGSTVSTPTVTLSSKPLIGAFRWDAWWPNNQKVFPQHIPANLYTDWSYRQPLYGWFDAGVSNAQAIMDQEINDAADHGLDFWAFDDYKWAQDFPQQGYAPLYDAFKEYNASPYKSRLKFAIAVSSGIASGGGNMIGYWRINAVPYLVAQFKDPQYLKVSGNHPVLFWQSTQDLAANFPNWSQDHAYLNQQTEAAGLGDPIIIDTSMSITNAKVNGLDGVTTYGVMGNGAKPTSGCVTDVGNPTYHCPFSSQSSKDESNWNFVAQSGLLTVPGLTPVNDSRALTTPYGFYVDQPTYTQWEQEIKDAFAFMTTNASKTNPPIAVIYAWNELNEGGPGIIPTKQNGTMYLDAIKAVKTGNYPSTYQDIYNGDNSAIILAAANGNPSHWTNYFPVSVMGYFNNDEEISQGIGESATLSVDNATGFEVKATEGPNRGKMQVFIDGLSQGTVNVNNTSWLSGQSVFKSPVLSAGTHALRLVNVSTDVGATSFGIDEILVSKQRFQAALPNIRLTTPSEGCAIWPSPVNNTQSLQDAVNANMCVSIAAGSYMVDADVVIPSNHTLKGANASSTILKANPQTWKFGYADALLTHSGATSGINISGLTLDASGIATYGIVASGMTIDNMVITNARCSAVALNGPGIILRNSTLDRSGQTTTIPGRGSFNCASIPSGATSTPGVALGAGIYGEGYVSNRNFAPDIENNTIKNNIGPGMDINNVDGGTFANNIVFGNSGWAGVSLFETTSWQVLNNTISHPSTEPAQPYHPFCARGPNGPRSAGIFLCSDSYNFGGGPIAPSTRNRITGNQTSSFYGILLVGAGTAANPALSPYGNDIENNNVCGSVGPCGDSFNPAWSTTATPANTWSGNNCGGAANTAPYYF